MEEINRYEITEFVIPDNPLEITSIWYVEPAYREEYLTVPESERPPKVSPEEVETCLSACPNIESLDISWDYE